ncbi:MAG: hypothetical protein EBX50_01300 [Chitinophagia bacterium]|nr:hypothetical protein [Chitinophagia bacterium]
MEIETKKNIFKAYINAKKRFTAVLKSKTNPMYKSKYADITEIISAIEEPLLVNNLSFYHEGLEPTKEGYIALQLVLMHESGEELKFGAFEFPAGRLAYKKDKTETYMEYTPQTYGSAMTYLRRYTLLAGFGLATEDDDGNYASAQYVQKETRAQPNIQQTITQTDKKNIVNEIINLIEEIKNKNILTIKGEVIDINFVKSNLGYKNLEDAEYNKLLEMKKNLLKKLGG